MKARAKEEWKSQKRMMKTNDGRSNPNEVNNERGGLPGSLRTLLDPGGDLLFLGDTVNEATQKLVVGKDILVEAEEGFRHAVEGNVRNRQIFADKEAFTLTVGLQQLFKVGEPGRESLLEPLFSGGLLLVTILHLEGDCAPQLDEKRRGKTKNDKPEERMSRRRN
jgi:hypothetical protein